MEKTYNLNELAMMTGFSTRTLRNYLVQGLLKGNKVDGAWEFSAEDLDKFFNEPFVKESLRIKRNSAVFDFLSQRDKKASKSCVILDIPCSTIEGNKISTFFCNQMSEAYNVEFSYDWDKGVARIILTGEENQVLKIISEYNK